MNNTRHQLYFFVIAFACAALVAIPGSILAASKAAAPAAAQNQAAGELVIKRSANLGSTIVGLSIDGKQVAKINFNGSYKGSLPAGPHTLSAVPIPNSEHADPTQKQITVQAGKTYTFTAYRNDVRVILK